LTIEDSAVYMTAPDRNGTPSLPKRAGVRTMVPTTWIDRTLRVEYVGAGGEARETTATFLDWTPVGLLLNIAGAKTLLAWERLVMCELIED
jgi:hypothetical protein